MIEDEHGLRSLIQRCNLGDRQAWEEFYTNYFGLVSSVARRYMSQPGDVDDLIQEVFLTLFKALKNYDPSRSIEAYILEIARRVRIGQYRKVSAAKRAGNPVAINILNKDWDKGFMATGYSEEDQEHALIKEQEKKLLRRALEEISENCRNLLALRYDRALTYKEIADILNTKEVTLRSQLQRCLATLSKNYSKLAVPGGR